MSQWNGRWYFALKSLNLFQLGRISHLLRFSFSLSAGVFFFPLLLRVWDFIALCQCYHSHTVRIDRIDSVKVVDAIELGFMTQKVKKTANWQNFWDRKLVNRLRLGVKHCLVPIYCTYSAATAVIYILLSKNLYSQLQKWKYAVKLGKLNVTQRHYKLMMIFKACTNHELALTRVPCIHV